MIGDAAGLVVDRAASSDVARFFWCSTIGNGAFKRSATVHVLGGGAAFEVQDLAQHAPAKAKAQQAKSTPNVGASDDLMIKLRAKLRTTSKAAEYPNRVAILCPFHNDTNPSAVVMFPEGLLYCSACSHSWNLRKWVATPEGRKLVGAELAATLTKSTATHVAYTDTWAAEQLAAEHGRDLRWCKEFGWLAWDGRRWMDDGEAGVQARVKQLIDTMHERVAKMPEGVERAQLAKFAAQCEGKEKRYAIADLARWEFPVNCRVDEFDQNLWLLNVENGTIDLRDGKLREQRREEMISKLAPAAHDPSATCPTWGAFLVRITGANAAELVPFLCRAVGYSLTGDVREQVLFFLYGTGANGKTTLTRTLLSLAGDYGKQAAPNLLVARKHEGHSSEQAHLFGARVAITTEVGEGEALAEVAVKQMTGGDKMVARYLYQEPFEFDPTFKLWLCANHRPQIVGTDNAIWRRILLVPFDVTIPEEQRDPQLAEKLKQELPGILNWAVDGALEWQATGLRAPACVLAATKKYRSDMDTIGDFIADCCVRGPNEKERAKDLYSVFVAWCERNGQRVLSQTMLGTRLQERGFEKQRSGGIVWLGIGLREQE
jgi:putative DNA primase/helicase